MSLGEKYSFLTKHKLNMNSMFLTFNILYLIYILSKYILFF